MSAVRLTPTIVLDRLRQLFALTTTPVRTTKHHLANSYKFSIKHIDLLVQHGILSGGYIKGNRKNGSTYQWIGIQPNIHMAEKLLDASKNNISMTQASRNKKIVVESVKPKEPTEKKVNEVREFTSILDYCNSNGHIIIRINREFKDALMSLNFNDIIKKL